MTAHDSEIETAAGCLKWAVIAVLTLIALLALAAAYAVASVGNGG